MEPYYPFIRWSTPHLSAVALSLLLAILLIALGRWKGDKASILICRSLGALLLLELIGETIWRFVFEDYGSNWRWNLPLHFCSFMAVAAFIALWFRKPWACCVCYFGIMSASIQGLITPAMANGYPSLAFFVFFFAHGLLLVVGLAIPLLIGWRASIWDPIKAFLMMDAYLLFIIPVNLCLRTNYGYTRFSPVEGCILDYCGTAPWYYLWLQLPVLAIFYFLYLFVRRHK